MNRAALLLCVLGIFTTSQAQFDMHLYGALFNVELNEEEMTATISDHSYKVDDDKYPIYDRSRRFKSFEGKKSGRIVRIPSTYKTADGKEYAITTIGRAAFADYQNADVYVIPPSVTTIQDYAFFRSSVVTAEIPASVKSIGNRVFGWCKNLKRVELPKGVFIGNNCFSNSKNLDVAYYTIDDSDDSDSYVPITYNEERSHVLPIEQQQPVSVMPEKKKVYSATSSDVDVDLPSTSKTDNETFAVVIANEKYSKAQRVDCALNDGRAFHLYCREVLGLPNENVHLVENATSGQIAEEIDWLSQVASAYEGDARIIVYYAGHGVPNEKDRTAYLLPVDASPNNTAAAISLSELYKQLGNLTVRSVTLFLDACFSGATRGDGMLTAARGVALKAKEERPKGNMVVFSAAKDDETAYPYTEKGHGLFTYFLLKKIKETKGNVDYATLGEYIRKEVRQKAAVVNHKPQNPTVSYSPEMAAKWNSLKLTK